ncbi:MULTISPECIES: Ig-like domain-containing protein [Exiguobacterium]|uniref:Ig-like domain-containing protein n=1 Tax=Exiguobacterium TaxID=33986 RepID=UPI001BE6EA43|nr:MULTISPECIES: Ig-like domain-containing protein [unclassified Exiguobacterium]
MANKKQFVTAAAAFAVTAAAVAPAMSASAAMPVVKLSSDYVRQGNLDAALDKTYHGSEIHWYKSSVNMNKLGVFQTAVGFVKGKGIKVEKRVRVLNYAQEVIGPKEMLVFEKGQAVSGIRSQPVKFADRVYMKPGSWSGIDTSQVGEFTATFTYSNKAYGTVSKSFKYKVVESAPMVSSVELLNAKELQINFSKPVDASTLLYNGMLKDGTVEIDHIPDAQRLKGLRGTLSKDGKTLVVRAEKTFDGRYAVLASSKIKGLDGKDLVPFKGIYTLTDNVRPVLNDPEYLENNRVKFTFSEPVNVDSEEALEKKLELTDASGAGYKVDVDKLSWDGKSFILDLSDAQFVAGKDYKLTLVGLRDFAGNFITPNPVTKVVQKKVVDGVAPAVVGMSSSKPGYLTVTFSEAVYVDRYNHVAKITLTNGDIEADLDDNAWLDESGKVLTVRDSTFIGQIDVKVSEFRDLAGNYGAASTKLVNFTNDATAPTVTGAEVKVIDGKNHLVLTFSEEVNALYDGEMVGSYITPNGVEKKVKAWTDASYYSKNQIKTPISDLELGNYSVTLPKNLVEDVVGNASAAQSIKFSITSSPIEKEKPTFDGYYFQEKDNSTLYLKFSEKLDPSSLYLGNFLIEGKAIAEKAVFTNEKRDVIKLTLKEGAIQTSGKYAFTIQNVKDVAGNVMDTLALNEKFAENDLPGLTSAVLTSNNVSGDYAIITLTFDESIADYSIEDGYEDFKLFVGDQDLAKSAKVSEVMGSQSNQVKITVDRVLTPAETAQTLTLKPGAAFEVLDLANNKHPLFTSVNIAK